MENNQKQINKTSDQVIIAIGSTVSIIFIGLLIFGFLRFGFDIAVYSSVGYSVIARHLLADGIVAGSVFAAYYVAKICNKDSLSNKKKWVFIYSVASGLFFSLVSALFISGLFLSNSKTLGRTFEEYFLELWLAMSVAAMCGIYNANNKEVAISE